MRVGIMQPYFFPYTGHFSLIAATDEWLVFDLPQYTPKTWINRNRIAHPASGWKWLTAPLANGSIHIRIHEARLLAPEGLAGGLLNQLTHYRRAPFYAAICAVVREVASSADPSLTALNVRGLQAVCTYLGLPFRYRLCSALGLDLPPSPGPGGWAPAICAALGARSYVNPVGGRHLFDPAEFERAGTELLFLQAEEFAYKSGPFGVLPGLSILDALMWNPPERVREAVLRYTLLQASPMRHAA